jgi:hypothetical protein
LSPLQKSQSAPEIETDSARRLTTKSIKLIHAAHAKATQAIEQHIAPGYEAGLPAYQLNKLQRVQNAAARIIRRLPKFCHITPVLRELHWLSVKFRIDYKILLLTYKGLHEMCPDYLKDLLVISNNKIYNLRSSDSLLLKNPSFKSSSTLGDRSFQVAAPILWNALPGDIRDITNLDSFKRSLKTYLFKIAFNL